MRIAAVASATRGLDVKLAPGSGLYQLPSTPVSVARLVVGGARLGHFASARAKSRTVTTTRLPQAKSPGTNEKMCASKGRSSHRILLRSTPSKRALDFRAAIWLATL